MGDRNVKSEITSLAKKNAWKPIPTTDPYMVSFKKYTEEDTVRINVWINNRNNLLTVGTYLKHPKQGRTQLFRKHVDLKELSKLFKNPRSHTGKGYR